MICFRITNYELRITPACLWLELRHEGGIAELRSKIIKLLDTVNISYPENVFEFDQKQKSNTSKDVVAHNVQGESLTKAILLNPIMGFSGFLIGNAQLGEKVLSCSDFRIKTL